MSDPVRDGERDDPKRAGESPPTDVPPSADEALPADTPDARAAAPAMDVTPVDAPAADEALPPEIAATTTTVGDAAPPATPVATAGGTVRGRRRAMALAAVRRVLLSLLVLSIFAGGVALGVRAFQIARPGSPVADVLDPGVQAPSVAQEFISALAANDMDGVRSSLGAAQHRDITEEMTRFGIYRVDRVEVLGTQVDGPRSATAIMMLAENADGLAFGVNLVILVDGGKIEGFR